MEKTDRKLSKQELKVVILLSQGYTQSQIAKKLYVSLETIRTHVKSARFKFEAKNTPHMIRIYCEKYILPEINKYVYQ